MTFAASSSGPLVLIYYHFEYPEAISAEGKYAYPAITPFSPNVFRNVTNKRDSFPLIFFTCCYLYSAASDTILISLRRNVIYS